MITALDLLIFQWFNSWAGVSFFWDWAILFCATYLLYIVVAAILLIFVLTFLPRFRNYWDQNKELVIVALVSAFVSRFVVTEIIRYFYNRPRPFEIVEGARKLMAHPLGSSFPSGHAALAFAVAATVSFYYPKSSILFFLAAIFIGIGRVSAGIHWPSDILGGALVGVG